MTQKEEAYWRLLFPDVPQDNTHREYENANPCLSLVFEFDDVYKCWSEEPTFTTSEPLP